MLHLRRLSTNSGVIIKFFAVLNKNEQLCSQRYQERKQADIQEFQKKMMATPPASTPTTFASGTTKLMEAPIVSTRQNITFPTRCRIFIGSELPFAQYIRSTGHESHSLRCKRTALGLPKILLRIVSHHGSIL